MQTFEPKLILVPTDFSDAAAHALRYASSLGERFGAHLRVIFADTFLPPVDVQTGVNIITQKEMAQSARLRIERFARQNVNIRVTYDTAIVVKDTVVAILDEAKASGANLIVMGTHGRSGVRRLLFGSVTESVMQTASVPVIAVNESTGENAAIGKVLCKVNFTKACRDALRAAAALVNSRSAPLVLVRGLVPNRSEPSTGDLIRLHQWVPPDLVDRCELKIVPLLPEAEDIIEFAETTHADLIALGIPPDRTFGESLRGTVAERIVRNSRCPVLTVNVVGAQSGEGAESERELAGQVGAA
jgi:nucleotide-binding universal stress UspA family protein